MGRVLTITKKELSVYFTTPLAYAVFTIIAFFGAQFFGGALDQYRQTLRQAFQFNKSEQLSQINPTDLVLSPTLGSLGLFLSIVAPFLSMRLLADEKRGNTFELLMTSPAR